MKRLFVIGDVHGCLNELIELLKVVDSQATPEDEVVFLGDYVDRGPDSKGVIDLCISRINHPVPHTFLTGNHEQMMLTGDYWMHNGGVETLRSYGICPADHWTPHQTYVDQYPADHLTFLKNLKLYHKVGRTVCVHAGLIPAVCLSQQNAHDMVWDRDFVKWNGPYAGGEYVVHGHTPVYTVDIRPNQLNIDTACVFGGMLTCAVIEPETGDIVKVISEKSKFSWSR